MQVQHEYPQKTTFNSRTENFEDTIIAVIEALVEGDFLVEVDPSTRLGLGLQKLTNKLKETYSEDLDRVVTLSMGSNETAIQAARLLYSLKGIDSKISSIGEAAEKMRSAAELIDNHRSDIGDENQSTTEVLGRVEESFCCSIEVFRAISTAVSTNSEKVTELSIFARQVRDISEEIRGIAFQTNLLALNASVESARAGAAGAGFGVVAQEMRVLSRRSAEATQRITDLAGHFEAQMNQVSKALQNSVTRVQSGEQAMTEVDTQLSQMKVKVGKVSDSINNISLAISNQNQASQNVADSIAIVADNTRQCVKNTDRIVDSMDRVQSNINTHLGKLGLLNIPSKIIKLAQSDHVIWKKRLINMMSGKEGLWEEELANHKSCRLGRWYEQVDDERIRNSSCFRELRGPHEQVHTHGKLAVAAHNRGDLEEALRQIELVERASIDVLRLLKSLEVMTSA